MKKTTVITGTTHGIGRVSARELARAGHRVIMLVRDLAAGLRVRDEIAGAVAGAELTVVRCDLSVLDQVRQAAERVRREAGAIDCLINNAGTVSLGCATTVDGFERVFATNHLGPFLLTGLLLDRIAATGRIINVASRAHYQATLDLGQVVAPSPSRFRARAAYAQSKLANVLHGFALARRLAGSGIAVNCLHPGVVRSNLLPRWIGLVKPLVSPGMIGVERGARTTLYLALDDQAGRLNGHYLDEHQRIRPASPLACSEPLQEALWAASARWVGLESAREAVRSPVHGASAGVTPPGFPPSSRASAPPRSAAGS